jgi:hypothetical protein
VKTTLSLAGNVVIAIGIGGFALLARSLPLEVFGEWVLFIAAGSLLKCLDLVLLTQA